MNYAQRFQAVDTVLLESQGKYVVFSPDTFRLFRMNSVSASVISQINAGASSEEAAAALGIEAAAVDRLLATVLASLDSAAPIASVRDSGERPLQSGRLKKLVLMVNNFCNLQCTYCYEHETVFKQQARHMTPEVIRKTFEEFYTSFTSIEDIMFIGGEPTLSEDAIEVACRSAIEEAAVRGVERPNFSMITNGARLSEHMFELVERFSIQLTFSVDGPPPVQDLIRIHHDKSGSYSHVKKNFDRYAKMEGAKPNIETTLTRAHHNSRITILDLVDFLAKEFGIVNAHVVPAGLREGDPLNIYVAGDTSFISEIESAASVTVDRMMRRPAGEAAEPAPGPVGLFDLAADMVMSLLNKDANPSMCPAGTSQLVVDARGDIYPCWMFSGIEEHSMGNILTDGLENPRLDAVLGRIGRNNKLRNTECSTCYARHVCHACIGNHHNINGSIEAVDRNHCNTVRTTLRTVLVKIGENRAALKQAAATAMPEATAAVA